MTTLKGDNIYLRALEPEDLEFVHSIENDTNLWHLSDTQTPYSRFLIKQYLKNAQQDIFEAKQLRLAISNTENQTIGLIDVFDFDIKNKRAGIGILIQDIANRNQGYGKEALELLVKTISDEAEALGKKYIYALIKNKPLIDVYKKVGFKEGDTYTHEMIKII